LETNPEFIGAVVAGAYLVARSFEHFGGKLYRKVKNGGSNISDSNAKVCPYHAQLYGDIKDLKAVVGAKGGLRDVVIRTETKVDFLCKQVKGGEK